MTLLALRNLVSEKTRFAFSAAGIGFAVFLITMMLGLYQGWNTKVGGFVETVDADAWVARKGTTDFINAASILPDDVGGDIAATNGVTSVHPLIVRLMSFEKDGKKVDLHLIGYDVASGVGGPAKVTKGAKEPSGNQIIIDETLSRTDGVKIGDELKAGDMTLEVVGIASGANFAISQGGFMDVDSAREMLKMPGLSTFYLSRLDEGADARTWGDAFSAEHPDLAVFTSGEFASATRHRILDNIVPILFLIVGLAFVVGIAVTSLTIYTATVERAREFGVMKAIGFDNMDLYKLVISQSLITGFLGFVWGALLTYALSQFVDLLVPQFLVNVRLVDLAFVLGATLLMAALASIVPARRVGAVDPAVVFRG